MPEPVQQDGEAADEGDENEEKSVEPDGFGIVDGG